MSNKPKKTHWYHAPILISCALQLPVIMSSEVRGCTW